MKNTFNEIHVDDQRKVNEIDFSQRYRNKSVICE